MIFIKSFKGYEDKTLEIDKTVNDWIAKYKVDVVDVKALLSHEPQSRAGSGDLIYTVLYKSEKPL
ncbi:MAG: hypothetical protein HYV27_01570 [Candidatus Hydrogenedentes bacterium]|nr:hypothetical protein [Candidatus Hydrogenedentota bacterium]